MNITAVIKGDNVEVTRPDVKKPMIYTPLSDGYAYWKAQAKAQAGTDQESFDRHHGPVSEHPLESE